MIKSFRNKDSESVWKEKFTKRFPKEIQRNALKRLLHLNSATSLHDLKIPLSNRLHALSGDRSGEHSISINDQWRICFRWKDGHAEDVEIVDYH